MHTEIKESTLLYQDSGELICCYSITNYQTKKYRSMHIAYSALRTKQEQGKPKLLNKDLTQRYEGYQKACNKYRAEIAEIQKYMPGWLPPFKLKA